VQQLVAVGIGSISRDAEVIVRLRRRKRGWKATQYVDVVFFCLFELAPAKTRAGKTGNRSRHEFLGRQIPVPTIEFVQIAIEHQQIGRPNVMEALDDRGVGRLRVIDLNRDRVIHNQLLDGGLRIRHGIQRLASPSTGVEKVEQDEFVLLLGARRTLAQIVKPIDHGIGDYNTVDAA
jgi:hypothetical protein